MVARLVGGLGGGAVIGWFVGAILALVGGSPMLFVLGVLGGAVIGAVLLVGGWLPRPSQR